VVRDNLVMLLDDARRRSGEGTGYPAFVEVDQGFHPPTVYFPLIVPGAIMIEPTGTEDRQIPDEFVAAMEAIAGEAAASPDALYKAPERTAVSRPDEVEAARKPVLTHQA